MAFVPLFEYFEEVAARETRVVTILPSSSWNLPPDDYAFIEMFCNDYECDCRRVFFYVDSKMNGNVATITYGWENRAFYREWLGSDLGLDDLIGSSLNLMSSQSKYAPELLNVFTKILAHDKQYIERVKRHYSMVRKVVNTGNMPAINQFRHVGRNDLCPCGSGKEFKQCCLQ